MAPQTTKIALPADGRIPTRRQSEPSQADDARIWHEPYTSDLLTLESDVDEAAWFHFCHGHHVEFLIWGTCALACERVTAAIGEGDDEEAARWLGRSAALTHGSGALLYFCGALDAETYDRCLRPGMEAERGDFSGDMSRELLSMMEAKAAMLDALTEHGDEELITGFHSAERVWYRHHGEVVRSLHPAASLLKQTVDRLTEEVEEFDYQEYLSKVVRGEQALADYDDFFGVVRTDSLTLDDYWTQALEKLAAVHHGFTMTAEQRGQLMRGDAVLLAVVSELLET